MKLVASLAVLSMAITVVACGSARPATHPGQAAAAPPVTRGASVPPSSRSRPHQSASASACTGGVIGPWPGYCTIFGPLPKGTLATQLATLDRDYQLAWNQAVYTKGASTRWESYVTTQMEGYLHGDLPSDIAYAANNANATVRITDTMVSAMPDFAGNEMVDFCIYWNGKLYEEEQDALSQVNGAWKINTIDTFTSTSGHTLPGEGTECYSSAAPGT